jgi:hypothetical protein
MAEQDVLALWSQYGDLYNEIVRPERKYTVSHYLRTQWAPLLGPARLWFVVALRQRCFWNHKQDWCVVDKKTLARESGLSLRTVNRIISAVDLAATDDGRDGWTGWFFSKTRRRRYHQAIGRTVNAPNRYHVLLDDPLTPAHQAALARYLQAKTAGGTPEDTQRVLQDLCERPGLLHEILSPPPDVLPRLTPAAFVLDIVRAVCPLPPQESAPYLDIAQSASQLHNAITRPERVYIGNQYFRLRWLPELGPVLASLVVNLRARCYWNQRTGELRDTCQVTWAELAQETGCTTRQLRNLRQKPGLAQFMETLSEGHGRARSTFRVRLYDPLTAPDRERFEDRVQATPGIRVDPETGQLDIYPLLARAGIAEEMAPGRAKQKTGAAPPANAETLAQSRHQETRTPSNRKAADITNQGHTTQAALPSSPEKAEKTALGSPRQRELLASSSPGQEPQAEEMAPGDRKIWHLEGVQAELLAPQPGNSGTTRKIQLITPNQLGLAETTLSAAVDADRPETLLAAVRTHLLAQLGIQEPNRSKLLTRQPRCDWIIAWGLYVLTQPGLSKNKAGYIYNRLWNSDPPPPELLALAGLSPPVHRLFCRAEKRGQMQLVPDDLLDAFALWRRMLASLCDLVVPATGETDDLDAQETSQTAALPEAIVSLLLGPEDLVETDAGWEIETRDLAHAVRLTRAVRAVGYEASIAVFYRAGRQRCSLNAAILALTVEPLSKGAWDTVRQELQWQMSRGVFDRWWREVQPLGIATERVAMPCVVLGAPSADVRAWIVSKQMPIVQRTLAGVLGQPVDVRIEVYAEPLPSVRSAQGD